MSNNNKLNRNNYSQLNESGAISDPSVSYIRSSQGNNSSSIEKADQMPMLDRVILGPIKKYQKYNHFPWKLLIHVSLLIVCTAQVILVVGSQGAYSRTDQTLFFTLFLDEEAETEDPDFQKFKNIFDVGSLQEEVTGYLDNYFGIQDDPEQFFDNFELVEFKNKQGEKETQVIMDIFYLPGVKVDQNTPIRHVFTADNYGIFGDNSELRSTVRQAKYFTMTYHLNNKVPMNNANNEE